MHVPSPDFTRHPWTRPPFEESLTAAHGNHHTRRSYVKRLIMLVLLLAALAGPVAAAFATTDPPRVPVKGLEGPDVRYVIPPKGIEGPDVR